jgi:hypothetical protein
MALAMMTWDSASVSVPSRPYPTSMRTLRSAGATSSNTPLFFLASPSFQARNSWFAKVSMSPPCSDFTVATTSWIPDLSSRSFNLVSIA